MPTPFQPLFGQSKELSVHWVKIELLIAGCHIFRRSFPMKISRLIISILTAAALIFGGNPSSVRSMRLATAPVVIHVPGDAATLQAAVSIANNGDIIELAAGTYTAPAGGWIFNDLGKGFTIRATSGTTVTLSGGGVRSILHQINSTLSNGRPIFYQDLIFANGYSMTNGIAGGVTLEQAEATFINCVFQNNIGTQSYAGGGGTSGQRTLIKSTEEVWLLVLTPRFLSTIPASPTTARIYPITR
jgi:hypothetical protein